MNEDPRVPQSRRDEDGQGLSRRKFLLRGAAAGAALALPGVLAACGGGNDEGAGATGGEPAETGGLPTTAAEGQPKRGGRLRTGHSGGGTTETLDAAVSYNLIDEARARQLYDTLTFFSPDYELEPYLAESLEPNADATAWQIKLRDGVTFHDGKPLTADDVLYTWRRVLDPKTASGGAAAIANVDLSATKKVSDTEIQVVLTRPQVDFPILLSGRELSIIPDGFTDFSKPVGTGPFVFDSFTPGQRSLFTRNPNYWQEGQPYVDELEMISIPDNTARVNALLGGQVDAIENLPFTDAKARAEDPSLKVVVTKSPTCIPYVMQLDVEPFTMPEVREALKLAIDREKTVETALVGFGQVGNDLFGKGTPFYADSIPQRTYDPEKAKSLLAKAGLDGLEVTLHTNPATVGNVESCQAFAEQAKAAGINVAVKVWDSGKYSGDIYNQVPFFQSYWNFPPEIMFPLAFAPTAPYNETHYKSAEFERLYAEAEATLDEVRRKEIFTEVQQLLWQESGYMVWGFIDFTDAVLPQVNGVVPHAYFNLGAFQFRTWWLS